MDTRLRDLTDELTDDEARQLIEFLKALAGMSAAEVKEHADAALAGMISTRHVNAILAELSADDARRPVISVDGLRYQVLSMQRVDG